MANIQRISKQEASGFPLFKSHEEASNYFEEKYGEKFVFEETFDKSDGTCYFYRLIIDEAAYIKGAAELNSNGSVRMDFLKSYQSIQIMEDGRVHIVH